MLINQIIEQAWKRSGLIDQDEVPQSSEISSGLSILNFLVQSLNAESWWPQTQTEIQFKLTGQESYTIGNRGVDNMTVWSTTYATNIVRLVNNSTTSYVNGDTVVIRDFDDNDSELFTDYTGTVISTVPYIEIQLDQDIESPVFGAASKVIITKQSIGLPDIISQRPLEINALKYKSGSIWYPVNNVSLQTWNQKPISESTIALPYQFRYLPSTPFGIIDFGSQTITDYNVKVYYDYNVTEFKLTDDINDFYPPEYVACLVYQLAGELLVDNGIDNAGVFAIAEKRKEQLKKNNINATVLLNNKKPYYDYRSGMNIY